jgi:hypothetical protein
MKQCFPKNRQLTVTQDWRVWLEQDGDPISFWHDIPLYPDEKQHNIVNFYVEIPRWTDAKIETKRDKPLSMWKSTNILYLLDTNGCDIGRSYLSRRQGR